MARLTELWIAGFRSVKHQIGIQFPEKAPVVLVGENNAGKSNIVHGLEVILGEMWPGSREPDDHDFWNRSSANEKIEIVAEVEGLPADRHGNAITGFQWLCDGAGSGQPEFRATSPDGPKYVSNELREACICVVIGADRKLSYQLSYATKWTLLSKLMRKFHSHLVKDDKRVKRLKESFENIKAMFGEVEEFAGFQGELKKQFAEMFCGMSYGLHVDFSAYDPSNYFYSLRVHPEEAGVVRTFEELGTGQEQLLALSFAHAYAKAFFGGIVLVIEEPEAHLHPLAQQWLARRIRQMAQDGLQIIALWNLATTVLYRAFAFSKRIRHSKNWFVRHSDATVLVP
jgi:putative ATP-dependent endonuclease of the OLD family